jgi:preprotein translocase subunit YajC
MEVYGFMDTVPTASSYTAVIALIALMIVFYLVLILPQRRRDKKEKAMRNSIAVGDYICTIGGFFGRVITVKENLIVIESGPSKTKMELYRWAIRSKMNADGSPIEEVKAGKKKKEEDK